MMIYIKEFVFVFILNLLSAQNGQASALGSDGTLRSPQRRSSSGKEIQHNKQFNYLVWITTSERVNTHSLRLLTRTTMCRGSIISERFILTSAHCAIKYSKIWNCGDDVCSSYEPKPVGLLKVTGEAVRGISYVKKVYVSPMFKVADKENQCTYHSDIALFELEYPVHFNDMVTKVKLPKPAYLGKVDLDETKTNRLANENKFCTILASSHDEFHMDEMSNLTSEKVQLIDTNKCIDYLKISNNTTPYKNRGLCTDTTVCSYDETRKERDFHCIGGSGSPLVCGHELIGLVSQNSLECHKLGIYTRIDVHLPWILSVIKNRTQT